MTKCPNCGHVLDSHQCVSEDGDNVKPEPGDLSICVYCSALAIYTENDGLRKPTREELEDLESIPSIKKAQRALLHYRKH